MNKRYLHIVKDEKFIDMGWESFERAFPGQNEFITFSFNRKMVFVKNTPIKTVNPLFLLNPFFIKRMLERDVIFIHFLGAVGALLVNLLPKSTKVCWIGWGADYYDFVEAYQKEKYLPLTSNLARKHWFSLQSSNLKRVLKRLIYVSLDLVGLGKKNAVERVQYFAPVIKEDYDLVASVFGKKFPKYVSWNYGNLEDHHLRRFYGERVKAENILLGNNATFPNNHLDAFSLIAPRINDSSKLIVPLSYGDKHYRDEIVIAGKFLFNEQFRPLIDFLPPEEYFEILQSCGQVVMNHVRQQAYGNVILALCLGARVYFNPKSPLYSFLRRKGCVVFSIYDFGKISPLSEEEVQRNIGIMESIFSRENETRRTKSLVEAILGAIHE